MHIEPGIVQGAKMALSYATAAVAAGVTARMAWDAIRRDGGVMALAMRSVITTALVFVFFEIMPHYPVGVSEVHFILGTTLLLLFGAGPAAIGLAGGLLLQGVLFAPADLPQYFINVTTLLFSLWAIHELAKRIIPDGMAYVDLGYRQVLALSAVYQGGIVAWVAFWALYGSGFEAANLNAVASFGAAYLTVIVIEPLADLAVLWLAKNGGMIAKAPLFHHRLHGARA